MADQTCSSSLIELEDEIEGETAQTTDYFFHKIGEPVPVSPNGNCKFDPQTLPSQPLAVSQRFQLIFVAHPSGFCVARCTDVRESANQIKEKGMGPSVQDLCLVDVPVGKVHILALSMDSSTLAASVSRDIHFFSVDLLLNKELEPSFSCSLNESTVKDVRWMKRAENLYVALGNHGKLYSGAPGGALKEIMDNVDAVEWSVEGNFIAVATKNILRILSSKFRERLCISLTFKSWIDDSDASCLVKVDSIKWIRPDCIILGCFQLTAEGKEENYLVQVLKSKDGKISDAASKPVVLSFSDLFIGLIDDMPLGSGPYLLLSYLEQCKLAITANRKNTDDHIVLFSWSLGEEMNDVSVLDIERDKWVPKIELQENDEDNLVLGLVVNEVSLQEKIKVQLGAEEERELSPYCILICLTLEGKIIMFNVSSLTGTTVPPEPIFAPSVGEDDISEVVPVISDIPELASDLGKPVSEQVQEVNKREDDSDSGTEVHIKDDQTTSVFEGSLKSTIVSDQTLHNPVVTENQTVKPATVSQMLKGDAKKFDSRRLFQNTDDKNFQLLGQQTKDSSFFRTTLLDEHTCASKEFSSTGTQEVKVVGSSTSAFAGKVSTVTAVQQDQKASRKGIEAVKDLPGRTGSSGLPVVSSQSWSSENFSSSKATESIFSSPSSSLLGNRWENSDRRMDSANVPGGFVTPFNSKSTPVSSASFGSGRSAQNGGHRALTGASNIESLPSIRSSQLSSQENYASEKYHFKSYPSTENYRILSRQGIQTSESNVSKQFGSIKEMAKELDTLLESIEETGGFMDACTVEHKNSIEAFEQGIQILSEKCAMWKTIMDERLGEIQFLLDKTVQVLTKKIFMEGVMNQVADIRYWDLWDHQKLSFELEQKQQHILKLNQELTNRLIELERHFNSLELNRFGQNDGVQGSQRALQSRFGSSRQTHSLHSLHNIASSQLIAAERLSDCLLKQMSLLSIESPHAKQQNVKRELFEKIGITYDASLSSSNVTKVIETPSMKKFTLSSSSASTEDQSRTKPSNNVKSYESETVRRRRDSLDWSLSSVEPSKTTVKRMLLKETQKACAIKSPFSKDKQQFNSYSPEESVAHLKIHTTPLNSFCPSGNKGLEDKQTFGNPSMIFQWASERPRTSQSTELKSSTFQANNVSASQLSPSTGKYVRRETPSTTAERSSYGVDHIEKSDSVTVNTNRSLLQSESNHNQAPSMSMRQPTETFSTSMKSSEISNSSREKAVLRKPSIGMVKRGPIMTDSSTFESGKGHNFSFPSTPAVPPVPFLPGKDPPFNAQTSKSKPGVELSPTFSIPGSPSLSLINSSAPTSSLSSSSSTAPALSADMSFSISLTTSKAIADANQNMMSISTSSASPSSTVSSSSSFSFQSPEKSLLSTTPPSMNSTESRKTEDQSSMSKSIFKRDVDTTSHAPTPKLEPRTSEFSVNVGNSVISAPKTDITNGLGFGSRPAEMASIASNVIKNQPSELPSAAHDLFQPMLLTGGSAIGGKNGSLNVAVTQEDEMEEVAPETSDTVELSLGSLGGFGIETTHNLTAPKANPLGGIFSNTIANQVNSPFTYSTPTGELFRPASFSFQSAQPSQLTPTNMGTFSGGFGTGTQASTQSGFGQPAQIGPGQQALGSVLGSFGQSRQIGSGSLGTGFAQGGGFGGGFAATSSTGGFSSAASGGGFAAAASGGGGFAALASGGGGFAGVGSSREGFPAAASSGSGFAGGASVGGFAAAGSGFGAFSSQQGAGGFSAFGGSTGGAGKPLELFTQMRK